MTMTTDTYAPTENVPPTQPLGIEGDGFQIHGNPAHIFGALAKAQAGFKPIVRSRTVEVRSDKGNYTFDYAPLDAVLAATMPSLSANGLCLFHTLGHQGQDVILTTMLGHESGSFLLMHLRLPGSTTAWSKDGKQYERAKSSQEMASDVTYRRRYMVSCLLGVSAEEDDDGASGEQMERTVSDKGPRQNTQQRPPSPKPSVAATAPKPDRQNVIPMTEKPEAKVEPKPAPPPSQPDEAPASRESLLEIRSLLKELGFTSGPGSTGEKWCQELIGLFPSQVHSQKHADILLDDLKKRKAS